MINIGRKIRDASRAPIDYTLAHKSETQPNMAMTIEEIIQRFVKGLPLDVLRSPGSFLDSDEDYEKLAGLDRVDQAYTAKQYAAQNEATLKELEENERRAQQVKEREAQSRAEKRASNDADGIDSLDNTMPNDTNLDNSKLSDKLGRKKT